MTGLYILSALAIVFSIASIALLLVMMLKKSKNVQNGEIDMKVFSDEFAKNKNEISNDFKLELDRTKSSLNETLKMNNDMVAQAMQSQNEYINKNLQNQNDFLSKNLQNQADNINKALAQVVQEEQKNSQAIQVNFKELLATTEKRLDKMRDESTKSLFEVRQDNEKQLTKMRETVDEKLTSTLDKRFNQSFKLVGERLDTINKSFQEMQNLQNGVNDLKRIFTNVKQRGTWGEVQLDALLSQILTSEQYSKNVNITKTGNELVDFVIVLPGKKDDQVYLPLDSKFPVEDYQRIVEASENANKEALETAGKALERRITLEAKSIRDKYIKPPKTTDFAIMYLPSEGMYAEVIKRPGLVEKLQIECRIVVCGPTTLAALLNSLQIGFKTVAIEKRSTEIQKLLAQFKKDFSNFSTLLGKTKKQLVTVTNTIDDAEKRTSLIQKRLSKVETLPGEKPEELDTESLIEPTLLNFGETNEN